MVLYFGYIGFLYVINSFLFFKLLNDKRVFYFALGSISLVIEMVVSGPSRFPSFSFLLLDVLIVIGCLTSLLRMVSCKLSTNAMWLMLTMFYYFISATIYLSLHGFIEPEMLLVMSNVWAVSNLIANFFYTAVLWKLGYSSQ